MQLKCANEMKSSETLSLKRVKLISLTQCKTNVDTSSEKKEKTGDKMNMICIEEGWPPICIKRSERAWVRASKWAFCAFMSTSYTSHLFNKREKLSMNQYPITCYLPQYVFLILWSLSALYGNNKKWTQWKLCARFFLQLIVVCWTSNKRLLFVARYNYRFDRAFFFRTRTHICIRSETVRSACAAFFPLLISEILILWHSIKMLSHWRCNVNWQLTDRTACNK